MTFVGRFHVNNRSELLNKATRISKSKEKDKRRFTIIMRGTLLPLYIISKSFQWIFRIPMYICIGIGSVMEYSDDLTEDIYHLIEDRIFLLLYRMMKINESEESE